MKRKRKHISASQLKMFMLCRRKWFYRYVLGLKQPHRAYLDFGKILHKAAEDYVMGKITIEQIENDLARRLVGNMEKKGLLPEPGSPHVSVERSTSKHGPSMAGLPIKGFVDLVVAKPGEVIELTDYKTCKNWDFVPTEDEIRKDVQAIMYSRWATIACNVPPGPPSRVVVRFRFIYCNKSNGDIRPVETELEFDYICKMYKELEATAAEMLEVAQQQIVDVPATRSACGAFGGCHAFATCHHLPSNSGDSIMGKMFKKGKKGSMSLKEALAAKRAAAAAEVEEVEEVEEDGYTEEQIAEVIEAINSLDDLPEKLADRVMSAFDKELIEVAYARLEDEGEDEGEDEEEVAIVAPDAPEDDVVEEFTDQRLEALDLKGRTVTLLAENDMETVEDVLDYLADGNALKDIKGLGKKSIQELVDALSTDEDVAEFMASLGDTAPTVAKKAAEAIEEDEEDEEDEAPAPKTKRVSKIVKVAKKPEPVTFDDGDGETTTLYINCIPITGTPYVFLHTLLEPLKEQMVEGGYYALPDYRDGQRRLAALVLENLELFEGQAIVADSRMPYASEVLDVLIGVADVVVQPLG
ncbi:MAG: PD-(D/E)XK nuclease family protein [Phycisphaerales bacterium JB052]